MGRVAEELIDIESKVDWLVEKDFAGPADVNDPEAFGFVPGEFEVILAGAEIGEALFDEKLQLSSPDSPFDRLHSLATAPRAIDMASKAMVDIWEDDLKR